MAKYDPNWLMKLQAKESARKEKALSHVSEPGQESGTRTRVLCGKGWGAKGYPSITLVCFPSINDLPSCRTCREKFLDSIGVAYDNVGYPVK